MTTPSIRVMVVGTRALATPMVPRDYRAYNNLVGGPGGPGSISSMRLPGDLLRAGFRAYCDDDAIARGQVSNTFATNLGHYRLQGPIVIFRDNGDGDEHSLSLADVDFLIRYLKDEPSREAYQDALQDQLFWASHPSGHAMYELDDNFEIVREITESRLGQQVGYSVGMQNSSSTARFQVVGDHVFIVRDTRDDRVLFGEQNRALASYVARRLNFVLSQAGVLRRDQIDGEVDRAISHWERVQS